MNSRQAALSRSVFPDGAEDRIPNSPRQCDRTLNSLGNSALGYPICYEAIAHQQSDQPKPHRDQKVEELNAV